MKIFIVKEEQENEYKIYKVADRLIDEFKEVKKDKIMIEATSIQDAIIQFSQMEKDSNVSFNSELGKFKEGTNKLTKSEEISVSKSSRQGIRGSL